MRGDGERATDFLRLTGDGFAFAGDAARGVRVDSGDGAIRPGGGAGHNVGRSPYWTRNHTQKKF